MRMAEGILTEEFANREAKRKLTSFTGDVRYHAAVAAMNRCWWVRTEWAAHFGYVAIPLTIKDVSVS
jgi:hypothetical protein